MKLCPNIILLFSLLAATPLLADKPLPPQIDDSAHGRYDPHRVDSHAPIGVMGDHTHEAGELMASYRYMFMDMRQNYVGSDKVSAPSQLIPNGGAFGVIPTNMQTEMQMIGLMYAPTDDVTLTAMISQVSRAMDHITAMGGQFTTRANGIGDFKFGGLVDLYEDENSRAHLNLMMSAPTGSNTETGLTPMGVSRLPYPMQLGSGTWDLMPGITFLGQKGNFSWGTQLTSTIRLGRNDEGYSLGNDITSTMWGAAKLSDSLSTSLRLSATIWGNVDGRDPLIGGPVPTADPNLQGGERIDLFWGFNYLFQKGNLKGHRLAIEAGTPLYQSLDGPRLGMDWMLTAGWQKAW